MLKAAVVPLGHRVALGRRSPWLSVFRLRLLSKGTVVEVMSAAKAGDSKR